MERLAFFWSFLWFCLAASMTYGFVSASLGMPDYSVWGVFVAGIFILAYPFVFGVTTVGYVYFKFGHYPNQTLAITGLLAIWHTITISVCYGISRAAPIVGLFIALLAGSAKADCMTDASGAGCREYFALRSDLDEQNRLLEDIRNRLDDDAPGYIDPSEPLSPELEARVRYAEEQAKKRRESTRRSAEGSDND